MEVMAVVLRPGLRCCGKGEDEHRQDRGDPDVGRRLHIGSLPELVHPKALAIAMLAAPLHGLVPRGAEGLCFRAGTATPLTVERRQTKGTDFDVAQIHRGLHHTMSIALLNFELHAGNHALSIALRASCGLPKPSSNFSISRSCPERSRAVDTAAAWIAAARRGHYTPDHGRGTRRTLLECSGHIASGGYPLGCIGRSTQLAVVAAVGAGRVIGKPRYELLIRIR